MHFADLYVLNVGHGSCAVVHHSPSGRLTMVDINNSKALASDERAMLSLSESKAFEAELDEPIAWFNQNFAGHDLFRFILSHPDADHMEGLHRILGEREINLLNFWDLPHEKESPEKFRTSGQQLDWEVYQDYRADPDQAAYPTMLLEPMRSDTGHYWSDDELQILSPDQALIDQCEAGTHDSNNMSRVLCFQFEGRSVLLPGDVETKGWNDVSEAIGGGLSADVLIASHHGRRSGYPPDGVVAQIDPAAVIVSAAKLPAEHDATGWYEGAADAVVSTRDHGTVVVRIWEDGELAIARLADGQKLFTMAPLR